MTNVIEFTPKLETIDRWRCEGCGCEATRLAARLLLGPHHPVTEALAAAVADPAALATALAELDALAAIPGRRLLATLAAVLPA